MLLMVLDDYDCELIDKIAVRFLDDGCWVRLRLKGLI